MILESGIVWQLCAYRLLYKHHVTDRSLVEPLLDEFQASASHRIGHFCSTAEADSSQNSSNLSKTESLSCIDTDFRQRPSIDNSLYQPNCPSPQERLVFLASPLLGFRWCRAEDQNTQ
jgi:hypothetical protein